MEKIISKSEVKNILKEFKKDIIFSVDFIKKNGKSRHMICRKGVMDNLSGNPYNTEIRKKQDEEKNMITVYDIEISEYRRIPFKSVNKIEANDIIYKVEE